MPQSAGIPEGFTPIFNGKDTTSHFSKVNHHGTTGKAYAENGELVLKQHPYGQGGLLLTDKRYHNFELHVEVKSAWGHNSGLFLRSTEGGSAYQVELNLASANVNLIPELLPLSKGAEATDLAKVWRDDDGTHFASAWKATMQPTSHSGCWSRRRFLQQPSAGSAPVSVSNRLSAALCRGIPASSRKIEISAAERFLILKAASRPRSNLAPRHCAARYIPRLVTSLANDPRPMNSHEPSKAGGNWLRSLNATA
jgi:hypothetical protein